MALGTRVFLCLLVLCRVQLSELTTYHGLPRLRSVQSAPLRDGTSRVGRDIHSAQEQVHQRRNSIGVCSPTRDFSVTLVNGGLINSTVSNLQKWVEKRVDPDPKSGRLSIVHVHCSFR